MVRVISRLLLLSLALSACATASPSPPGGVSTLPGDAAPHDGQPHAPSQTQEDVDLLRERVTRVERRLADVDAKLGLLIAQRQAPGRGPTSVAEGPSTLSRGRDAMPEPAWPGPREEGSLGARAVDLPPRGGMEPDAPEETWEGAVDDGSPPVLIRIDGRGAVASQAEAQPTTGAGPQIALGASVDEVYQYGQSRLKDGNTLLALAAFEDVTERAASHDLADNAMYWSGYTHAQRGDHKLALDVWQRLPVRYPKSPKIPDALFGMAQSHESLGEPALAETLYLELVTQYPKAEKVGAAQKALRRLRPR